jgi:hypothetical protein
MYKTVLICFLLALLGTVLHHLWRESLGDIHSTILICCETESSCDYEETVNSKNLSQHNKHDVIYKADVKVINSAEVEDTIQDFLILRVCTIDCLRVQLR